MTEPGGQSRSELQREALDRVRRLVSGEATLADVEDTKRWRGRSPEHGQAFAYATRLWQRLGPAGRNVARRGAGQAVVAPSVDGRRTTRRAVLGGALAAAAAYAVFRPPFEMWPSLSELAADYRTATGERREVSLADGATVELNTQTSIALRGGPGRADRIELINGEAVIATGKQRSAPVVVIAGDGSISSEDARFNVRYDGHATCVTCLEGSLNVQSRGAALTLAARYQVTYANGGLGPPVAIDPADIIAWKDGLLVFHETPLSAVVVEVNRYRPGKVVILNSDLGRRAVNARFRVENLDGILSLAHQVFGATVTALPGGLVVLS